MTVVDDLLAKLVVELNALPTTDKVEALNHVRTVLHQDVSPFQAEPVDCVQWVLSDQVVANNYNPNSVAPTEMQLLSHSISVDGYTQPIVGFPTGTGVVEVVDGFHRNRVGRENQEIRSRIQGYLPVVAIKNTRTGVSDRMAATIRHNRARGKHSVTGMSDIVVDLTRRNWSAEKIANELGMSPDEVLRLKQVTGLAELFKDREFSKAWEIEPNEP